MRSQSPLRNSLIFLSKSDVEADCKTFASHSNLTDASCSPLKIVSLKDLSYKPPVFVTWQTLPFSAGGMGVGVGMDVVGAQVARLRCRYFWHSSVERERVTRVFASPIRSSICKK